MIGFMGHPRFVELSRFADGELEGNEQDRIASHLRKCAKCRAAVAFVRQLGDAARELPVPDPAPDSLSRILARRAAGERVIIPVSGTVGDLPPTPERRFARIAMVLAPVLLIVGTLFVTVPRLKADRSELEIHPAQARAGHPVEVTYRSSGLFTSEEHLVLRARFRFEGGTHRVLEAGRLVRGGDGFRGTVMLPDSLVYAVFAVEDPRAEVVDHNGRRLWELIIESRPGRPGLPALRERIEELIGRDWEAAYRTARRMTELHPGRIESWYRRHHLERALHQATGAEAGDADFRERLEPLLSALLEREEPEAEELAAALLSGILIGDAELVGRARPALLERAPGHPLSLQLRASELARGSAADPHALLEWLEEAWARGRPAAPALASLGFSTALASGSATAALEWAARLAAVDLPAGLWATARVGADLKPGEEHLERLRLLLMQVEAGLELERPLDSDAASHARTLERRRQQVLATLGSALMASGATGAGRDTLRLAGELSWDPAVFERLAGAFLEAGDTAAALPYLARLAADPAAGPPASLRPALSAERSRESWAGSLAAARAAMRSMAVREAINLRLVPAARLEAPGGESRSLAELVGGEVAVLVFWSRSSAPALATLAGLEAVREELARAGVVVVTVADEPPSRELDAFLAARPFSLPVFSDPHREAAAAFDVWRSPEIFVLDGASVARFRSASLGDARRHVAVLLDGRAREPDLVD